MTANRGVHRGVSWRKSPTNPMARQRGGRPRPRWRFGGEQGARARRRSCGREGVTLADRGAGGGARPGKKGPRAGGAGHGVRRSLRSLRPCPATGPARHRPRPSALTHDTPGSERSCDSRSSGRRVGPYRRVLARPRQVLRPLRGLVEQPRRGGDGRPRHRGRRVGRPGAARAGPRRRRGAGVHAGSWARLPRPAVRRGPTRRT